MTFRDRIKALRRVKAADLLPHPRNWRQHPPAQLHALKGILDEVGWADAILARETPDGLQILDGHARAELADAEIPCLIVDVTDDEADKILATHDPIAMMAEANQSALDELLDSISTQSQALKEMLEGLRVDKWDIQEGEFPELPSGDKTTLSTMSFTVTADQRDVIVRALKKAKEEPFGSTGNSNANGNGLWRMAEVYVAG